MKNGIQTQFAGTLAVTGAQYPYQYRTMSVQHLSELQEDIERLRRAGQISDAETFQGYLSEMKFVLPENFPEAQTVLIVAIATPPLLAHFQFDGRRYPASMPPNYYQPAFTRAMMIAELQKRVIRESGYRVEGVETYHLKLLATRSGLGRYGRNNICYVAGMGSFLNLRAYLTDYHFPEDHWQEVQMLDQCQHCQVCQKQCPGGAIRADHFVIDVKRCLPLYNEIEGILPDWIPPEAHNAIFGCMKCQAPCPANREAMQRVEAVEDVTEEETWQFVNGHPDERILLSVSQKLKIPYLVESPETAEVIARNLKALLQVM